MSVGKGKKAERRFLKMGRLGRKMLKLSLRNGLDVDHLVINPDRSVEVFLSPGDADMVRVRGFAQ